MGGFDTAPVAGQGERFPYIAGKILCSGAEIGEMPQNRTPENGDRTRGRCSQGADRRGCAEVTRCL
ncbi:hypothetical protein GCM10025331_70580 [Actinoplanes utahensis]|nr:hypothetical protein Aut01nite_75050 [Actinoplanes utahensis]